MLPAGTKIFGIGLNKTGTTTLAACLSLLGFRHLTFNLDMLKAYKRGDLARVFAAIDRFDSFDDWPYPLMFEQLFQRYGETARFILTTRSTPDIWLNSLKAHTERANPLSHSHMLVYGRDYPHGYESEHIAFYNRHNRDVIDFFAAPARAHLLLPVCWESGDGWEKLCAFLDAPVPLVPFPHAYQGGKQAIDERHAATNRRNIDAQLSALARKRSRD